MARPRTPISMLDVTVHGPALSLSAGAAFGVGLSAGAGCWARVSLANKTRPSTKPSRDSSADPSLFLMVIPPSFSAPLSEKERVRVRAVNLRVTGRAVLEARRRQVVE